jgi:hypothetical protein
MAAARGAGPPRNARPQISGGPPNARTPGKARQADGRLGADGDTVSAGYSDDGVPFARSGIGSMMNAALNSGISVFENDGLNTVL